MGFWKNLFGGASRQPAPTAWDHFKQVAHENTERRRRTIEQGPRATPEEMASRIENLRSIDHLNRAYNDMRHADFCDAVSEAIRRGHFPSLDVTHALYVREWVSTGAAWRTSFPEWLPIEGRAHFLKLNDEWLRNSDQRTDFNDWMVGQKTEREAARPQPPAANDQAAQSWGNSWNATQPAPINDKWRREGGKLVCDHQLTAIIPEGMATSLRITCSVSRYLNGTIDSDLHFRLAPYLFLMPDEQPFEPHLVKAPFILGLVADGSGRGTEDDPIVRGGMFEVNGSAGEDDPETAFLGIISRRDTMLALRTLGVGTDLTLTLMDHDADPPVRLRLRLKGDPAFARLFESLRASV
ncbi:hypothetical protein [Bradyrhizobium diazoefficiens]|uniref:hypothetical protein n=1 Tax=Bradyrhizobium diazoefficiens TaxID=1355477 RepID=UPI0027151754|nr:hypothetical protein [Bradyrhizobium diazoefficiens]WLB42303.1 hypothetical protein QIH78_21675 [Bradyrhizobium diazoefficiens]